MGLIDSHAHLTYDAFAGRESEILDRCTQADVDRVITVGTDLADSRRAIDLAAKFPHRVHVAAGFHPHHADQISNADLTEMAALWLDPVVVGLGEMGLDYHYDFADRANQQRVFSSQLERAKPIGKPIIIHCREAMEDTVRILMDHGFNGKPVVFHCFTGSKAEAALIAEHEWRISFTGVVTFRKSVELQEIARAYPPEKLMIETDAPYLSPEPVRKQRPNEPAFVRHTAEFLAGLRAIPFEDLAEMSSRNTRSFFNLPEQPAR